MQERQTNRELYFEELAATSKKYFIPYISEFKQIGRGMSILEIGCGDGGNLLPFAEMGCDTTGVDISSGRIEDAIRFFRKRSAKGTFIASDIFKMKELEHKFDLIICHDVLEHIADKAAFLSKMPQYLKPGGLIFISFPAWQMPFGGHQQICRSKALSHLPFIHLLPACLYKALLETGGETQARIEELLDIKKTGTSMERFEKLVRKHAIPIVDRRLFLINPHYEVKFGLKPRRLPSLLAAVPYARNFFTTSCFYLLA